MSKAKICLFGGTFDPIHYGHLRMAEEALDYADQVWFMPTGVQPFKNPSSVSDPWHRFKMLELAIKGNKKFRSNIVELFDTRPCYTIDTVNKHIEAYPRDGKPLLLMGEDSFVSLPTWKSYKELLTKAKILVAHRSIKQAHKSIRMYSTSGIDFQATAIRCLQDISSTQIRKLVKQGKSIKYLVPEYVENYIIKNKLYKE